MDSDGLPLVGPGIDLSKVGAINQKRMLAFINHYLTNTVQYLNRFSCVCEEKLTDLTIKIQRLETTMNILEAKLSSIPGLENVTVAKSAETPAVSSQPISETTSTASSQESTAIVNGQETKVPETQAEEKSEPAAPTMTVSKDPRYIQFFKLITLGVPEGAIKQKMMIEGVDPSILDDPNAPVLDGGSAGAQQKAAASQQDDDSDDFSDDEHQHSSSSSANDDSDAFSD